MSQAQINPRAITIRKGDVIPHHWESEREVLGAIMIDPTLLLELKGEGLCSDDFHKPCHRELWELMNRMATPEFTSVTAVLSQDLALAQSVGGFSYVCALPGASVYIDHAVSRARDLRTLRLRRKMHVASTQIREWASDAVMTGDELLEKVRGLFDDAQGSIAGETWIDAEHATSRIIDILQKRAVKEEAQEGIYFSRWPTLMKNVGAAMPGKLWIIAARPAMGKSALANQMCLEASAQGFAAGYISLEMGVDECTERCVVQMSNVYANKLRDGELNDMDWNDIAASADQLSQMPLWFRFASGATCATIRGEVMKLRGMAHRKGKKLGMVVIDYLQLMRGRGAKQNQNDFITQVTAELKQLAGQAGVTIVLLSQLNREVETRSDKTPMMSDLRDSGSIEQDADVILFINRPSRWDENDRPGEADIIISKARGGQGDSQFATTWEGGLLTFGDEIATAPRTTTRRRSKATEGGGYAP